MSGYRNSIKPAAVLVTVTAVLVGMTWAIVENATHRVLREDAIVTAETWVSYLGEHVTELRKIATNMAPSRDALKSFETGHRVAKVFRHKIFDADGQLRFDSDSQLGGAADTQDLQAHNPAAWRAIQGGRPYIVQTDIRRPGRPARVTEAYMPVVDDGRWVAVIEVHIDDTAKHERLTRTFTVVAASLSVLTALAFAIPAVGWHRRTQEKRKAEARLRYLAHHDPQTGVWNRVWLVRRLIDELMKPGARVALYRLGIDRFDALTQALGEGHGDSLVRFTAHRLVTLTDAVCQVARVSESEFMLLQTDVAGEEEAREFANRIIEAMAAAFQIAQHEVAVTVSIGVAVSNGPDTDPEWLIKGADLALAKCGTNGSSSRVCVFSPAMDQEIKARLQVEKTLREAVAEGRFELHFQSMHEANTGYLAGFEALLRLPGGDGKYVQPAAFLPVAEDLGLMGEIRTWVIREACRVAATWPSHLTVAVNVAPSQLAAPGLVAVVSDALHASGLAASRLEIELTENTMVRDADSVMLVLRELKKLGVRLVMDDFGIGYSSLCYLWRFPFDKLKIDRAFLWALEKNGREVMSVVKTIVSLGRSLGMRVAAEGVETEQHAAFAREVACDELQGYLLALPKPVGELRAVILADLQQRLPAKRVRPEAAPVREPA